MQEKENIGEIFPQNANVRQHATVLCTRSHLDLGNGSGSLLLLLLLLNGGSGSLLLYVEERKKKTNLGLLLRSASSV